MTDECKSFKSYPTPTQLSQSILEVARPDVVREVAPCFDDTHGVPAQDEAMCSSGIQRDPVSSDISDSDDGLFITQNPVPKAVRLVKRHSSRSCAKPLSPGEKEQSDDDESLKDSKRSKWKKRPSRSLRKYSFTFLQRFRRKSNQDRTRRGKTPRLTRLDNINLKTRALGGFLMCAEGMQTCNPKRMSRPASSGVYMDEGGFISPLSEADETSDDEDIKIVDNKCFVSSSSSNPNVSLFTPSQPARPRKSHGAPNQRSRQVLNTMTESGIYCGTLSHANRSQTRVLKAKPRLRETSDSPLSFTAPLSDDNDTGSVIDSAGVEDGPQVPHGQHTDMCIAQVREETPSPSEDITAEALFTTRRRERVKREREIPCSKDLVSNPGTVGLEEVRRLQEPETKMKQISVYLERCDESPVKNSNPGTVFLEEVSSLEEPNMKPVQVSVSSERCDESPVKNSNPGTVFLDEVSSLEEPNMKVVQIFSESCESPVGNDVIEGEKKKEKKKKKKRKEAVENDGGVDLPCDAAAGLLDAEIETKSKKKRQKRHKGEDVIGEGSGELNSQSTPAELEDRRKGARSAFSEGCESPVETNGGAAEKKKKKRKRAVEDAGDVDPPCDAAAGPPDAEFETKSKKKRQKKHKGDKACWETPEYAGDGSSEHKVQSSAQRLDGFMEPRKKRKKKHRSSSNDGDEDRREEEEETTARDAVQSHKKKRRKTSDDRVAGEETVSSNAVEVKQKVRRVDDSEKPAECSVGQHVETVKKKKKHKKKHQSSFNSGSDDGRGEEEEATASDAVQSQKKKKKKRKASDSSAPDEGKDTSDAAEVKQKVRHVDESERPAQRSADEHVETLKKKKKHKRLTQASDSDILENAETPGVNSASVRKKKKRLETVEEDTETCSTASLPSRSVNSWDQCGHKSKRKVRAGTLEPEPEPVETAEHGEESAVGDDDLSSKKKKKKKKKHRSSSSEKEQVPQVGLETLNTRPGEESADDNKEPPRAHKTKALKRKRKPTEDTESERSALMDSSVVSHRKKHKKSSKSGRSVCEVDAAEEADPVSDVRKERVKERRGHVGGGPPEPVDTEPCTKKKKKKKKKEEVNKPCATSDEADGGQNEKMAASKNSGAPKLANSNSLADSASSGSSELLKKHKSKKGKVRLYNDNSPFRMQAV